MGKDLVPGTPVSGSLALLSTIPYPLPSLCRRGVGLQEKRLGQLRKYPNQPIVGFRYVGMKWASFAEEGEDFEEVAKKKVWGAKMPVEDNGLGLAT